MNFEEFSHKKILGVPALYLTAGAVVILGVVAWRLKPTPDTTSADTTTTDTTGDTGDGSAPTLAGSDYSGLGATDAGLTVTAPTVSDTTANVAIPDNDAWVSQGVQWLVAQNKATSITALQALTNFVNGGDSTYAQGLLVNAWSDHAGPPPDPLTQVGKVGAQPAKRQFSSFPGTHKVMGSSDNTYTELAQLYYGTTANDAIDLLQAHNTSLGHSGPFPVGTVVNIPLKTAKKYYTATTATHTLASIAAKNGISQQALTEYNDTIKFPVKPGTKVRVG